jgi:hypothetical protein
MPNAVGSQEPSRSKKDGAGSRKCDGQRGFQYLREHEKGSPISKALVKGNTILPARRAEETRRASFASSTPHQVRMLKRVPVLGARGVDSGNGAAPIVKGHPNFPRSEPVAQTY